MKFLQTIRAALGSAGVHKEHNGALHAGMLNRDLFRRELLRHRAQVDRAGGSFMLAIFDTPSSAPARGMLFLADIVRERARLSDVVGIYDEPRRRIAVLLPETTAIGAASFVRSVEDLLRTRLNGQWRAETPLQCELSQYPDAAKTVDEEERPAAQEQVACGESRS